MLTGKDYDGYRRRSNEKSSYALDQLPKRPEISRNIARFPVAYSQLRHLRIRENRVWRLDPAHYVFRRILQVAGNIHLALQMSQRRCCFSTGTHHSRNAMASATPVALDQIRPSAGIASNVRLRVIQCALMGALAVQRKEQQHGTDNSRHYCGASQPHSSAARITASSPGCLTPLPEVSATARQREPFSSPTGTNP